MLQLLAVSIAVTHLFRGLFQQRRGEHHIALPFRLFRHALESAKPHSAMTDRDLTGIFEKRLARLIKEHAPTLTKFRAGFLGGVVAFAKLSAYLDAEFPFDGRNDNSQPIETREALNDEGFRLIGEFWTGHRYV